MELKFDGIDLETICKVVTLLTKRGVMVCIDNPRPSGGLISNFTLEELIAALTRRS